MRKAKFKKIASQKGKNYCSRKKKKSRVKNSFTLGAKQSDNHTDTTEICQHKKSVAKTLVVRNLEACFNASSASDKDTTSQGSMFIPDLSEDCASQTLYSEQNQVGRTV